MCSLSSVAAVVLRHIDVVSTKPGPGLGPRLIWKNQIWCNPSLWCCHMAHCSSCLNSFDELSCRTAPCSHQISRPNQPTWYISTPAGCYRLHPPLPFIVITRPKSWFMFYHFVENRKTCINSAENIKPSWPTHMCLILFQISFMIISLCFSLWTVSI